MAITNVHFRDKEWCAVILSALKNFFESSPKQAEPPPSDDALAKRVMAAEIAYPNACLSEPVPITAEFKKAVSWYHNGVKEAAGLRENAHIRGDLLANMKDPKPKTLEDMKARLELEYQAMTNFDTGKKAFCHFLTIAEQYAQYTAQEAQQKRSPSVSSLTPP